MAGSARLPDRRLLTFAMQKHHPAVTWRLEPYPATDLEPRRLGLTDPEQMHQRVLGSLPGFDGRVGKAPHDLMRLSVCRAVNVF